MWFALAVFDVLRAGEASSDAKAALVIATVQLVVFAAAWRSRVVAWSAFGVCAAAFIVLLLAVPRPLQLGFAWPVFLSMGLGFTAWVHYKSFSPSLSDEECSG